jgi:hypothetical protein
VKRSRVVDRIRKSKPKFKQKPSAWKEWKEFLKDDADYDYCYILRVLIFKLQRTKKYMQYCCRTKEDSRRISGELKEVIILLTNVMEDRYFEQLTKEFIKQHGKLKMKVHEGGKAEFSFSKDTPQTREQLLEQFRNYEPLAHKAKVADLKKAFDNILNNLWDWWE